MVKSGKLPSGKTEIPFEFPLQVKGGKILYETYHGVFVNIQVRADDSLQNLCSLWWLYTIALIFLRLSQGNSCH